MDASLKSRLNFHSEHPFKLGLFSINCSSGGSFLTAVPERWSATWEDNLRVAQLADQVGFDFMLPLARWKGFGGDTDFQGSTLETLTWATALLAKTKKITVFSTTHVPLFHPIVAAKQMVMADHVSGGRFGLNIVCGWNQNEFDMFGVTMRDHETRYEYAQEWLDVVLKLWGTEDDFNYEGKFFKIKAGRGKPKPFGGTRPIFMNAAASPTGQAFAGRNCDAFFCRVRKGEARKEDLAMMKAVKEGAATAGRAVETFSAGVVVCRPTKAEAEAYVRRCTEEYVDWGAVANMARMWRPDFDKLPAVEREAALKRGAIGYGHEVIVGTPDSVADELAELHALGVRGYGIVMVNYLEELPYLAKELLPRLAERGLRVK